ncbi:hypothetical protein [Acetivibrio ethanolgignens]|uniref:Uncharacterized protein n=1 Tax=Acetivibrio ethanolgignens TaxID=290052 RepID=A0A0V8QH31_9FIRM|nr:hypothetical protein [Acetivibrio ethanolgignens]KSV59860.1 hypothetical protein ASU35_07610 [Acetivibrio ethanolgignens]
MTDMSWIHNPELKRLSPRKMELVTKLVEETNGKTLSQSIPVLVSINKTLQTEGLSFTEEESALILDILTRDMTLKEKQQVEQMKQIIIKQIAKIQK